MGQTHNTLVIPQSAPSTTDLIIKEIRMGRAIQMENEIETLKIKVSKLEKSLDIIMDSIDVIDDSID